MYALSHAPQNLPRVFFSFSRDDPASAPYHVFYIYHYHILFDVNGSRHREREASESKAELRRIPSVSSVSVCEREGGTISYLFFLSLL
jgi:hypothetical protein